jgi:hypothetical protein
MHRRPPSPFATIVATVIQEEMPMLRRTLLLSLLCATPAFAQLLQQQPGPLPTGVILVKGAVPSSSDRLTPLPEDGTIKEDSYINRYFGLGWPLPAGFREEFKGPPPSDSGTYVLAQLAAKGKGTVLVSAQDLFFGMTPAGSALEMVKYTYTHLPEYYDVEHPPAAVTIANHRFARFDYKSTVAGLHWYILATEIRCHLVQFVFTSRDPETLDALVKGMEATKLPDESDSPLCIADYAKSDNVVSRVDPAPFEQKFNPIPVRLTIGTDGKVKNVHVLSAFPDQARNITDALLQWRFKPRTREVETGILFGSSRTAVTSVASQKTAQ